MTKTPRELTAVERREIRRLVTGLCANYDNKYGYRSIALLYVEQMVGRRFPVTGRKVYCSEKCRKIGQKASDTKRVKKYRRNKAGTVTD